MESEKRKNTSVSEIREWKNRDRIRGGEEQRKDQRRGRTEIVWRACNLMAFAHSYTGPVVHPFASQHEGPGFNPQGGTYVMRGFSC
jgi:hypothetical protein